MSGRLDPPPVPRRDFLGLAGLATAGVALFGSLLGMLKLAKPAVTPEVSSRFRVGKAQDFPEGTEKVLPEQKVRILSTTAGMAALSLICTHLGCVVKEEGNDLLCPCHGSKFGPEGRIKAGPAPRDLQWLEVSRAADGSVVVDRSKEVPAGTFIMIV